MIIPLLQPACRIIESAWSQGCSASKNLKSLGGWDPARGKPWAGDFVFLTILLAVRNLAYVRRADI